MGDTREGVMSTANGSGWYYSEKDLQSLEYLDVGSPERGRLHELILEEPLSRLKPPKPIVLDINDTVDRAVALMRKFRFGSVLVIENGELVGIFTEKDLIVKMTGNPDLSKLRMREVMTSNPQALEEDDTLAHALNLMSVGGYRHVPILRDGSPCGFASIRGILRYISENALK